ncbi:Spy/CpxP family protein refolding chaperone [[Archangium] primigenium]|jgi:periplasmic protein CpxP/Spy|uniref:Spy/CpxP family protein refolding chaperone n=1 Tax=Melittangium TaxID=44 RepID=UPI00195C76DD|nr:Spy/CpxP family protein refolding chaperone [Archangium primigenium]MBM7114063.1 periplasmic heavy metal sensor [Archangium primigenium]
MKTRNKYVLAGTAVLAFVLLTGFRGGPWGGGARDPERVKQMITWRLDDRLEQLKATDAQKRTIQGLKDGLFEDGKQLMEGNKDAREQALAQWDAERPDATRVHALVDARVDALRGFAHKVADAFLRAHETLTPAQRQQVSSQIREHHAR